MSNKHEQLAYRLSNILARLNMGERLDTHQLAEEFAINIRTVQRDLNERLGFLDWCEQGGRYYRLDKAKLGHLCSEDITRFANFCSIQDLLPESDRRFYQYHLMQGVQVKGFEYENIKDKLPQFQLINQAIEQYQLIEFNYRKIGQEQGKYYRIEPYVLLNRNGIWYVIGVDIDASKEKTFCFTQMSAIQMLADTFTPNPNLQEAIKENDSIYHGNQLSEVIVQVSAQVAPYFLRRNLLPNQELVRRFEDGGLLLACKSVHENEVVPIVQYWIPHLTIINPEGVKSKMLDKLRDYVMSN